MNIFIAEADKDLRVGLQFLLHQQPGIVVTGIAEDGTGLSKHVLASKPDVLLLDWALPGKPINKLILEIQALELPMKIVAISIQPEDEIAAGVAGVDAFVTKAVKPDKLIALLQTLRSEATISQELFGNGE